MASETSPPTQGSQGLQGAQRLEGLDLARGLAVIGMMIAHTYAAGWYAADAEGPLSWLATMSHGRSAMLFAFCAGMSLAVLTGWPSPRAGEEAVRDRVRVLTRAVVLLALAALLVALGTPVYVILGYYAAWFAIALPFARWSARRLLVLAFGVALVAPNLAWLVVHIEESRARPAMADANGFFLETLATGIYPGAVYLAAVLAGMALMRADPRNPVAVRVTVGLGLACAVVGYTIGNVVGPLLAPHLALTNPTIADGAAFYQDPRHLLASFPHAATTPEALGSGGVAAVVVGLALAAPRGVLAALRPVRAVGALTLTAYCVHILGLWLVPWLVGTDSAAASAVFVLVIVGGCWAWWELRGKGPLESLVSAIANAVARPPSPVGDAGRA